MHKLFQVILYKSYKRINSEREMLRRIAYQRAPLNTATSSLYSRGLVHPRVVATQSCALARAGPSLQQRGYFQQPKNYPKIDIREFKDRTKAFEVTEQIEVESQKLNENRFTTLAYIRSVQLEFFKWSNSILFSEKKKSDDGVPEGFEKFLKRTRKGSKP